MRNLTEFLLVFPGIDTLSFTKIGDTKFYIVFHLFSFLLEQMLKQSADKKQVTSKGKQGTQGFISSSGVVRVYHQS
jgi:hypothetical protein